MSGFASLYREATEHPLFVGDSSRLGAWSWLILKACWKPTRFDINGKTVVLDRGQICVSRSQLAEAWGWKPSAVERFLTRLETEQMIERATGQGRTVITVCNYAKYQDVEDRAGQATGQATGQRSDSDRTAKEQGNHITIEPNGSNNPPTPQSAKSKSAKPDPFVCPEWAEPEVWADLLRNRKAKRTPNTPTAYNRFLKDLMAMVDEEWPPGRLLEAIVARGWAAAFDPRGNHYGNRSTTDRTGSPRREGGQRGSAPAAGFERRAFEARSRETAEAAGRRDDHAVGGDGELPLAQARALPGR